MDGEQQRTILGVLRKWAVARQAGRPARRALTPDEVMRLDQDGIVEVGAHTTNHSMLSVLPEDAQKSEIIQSKRMLEEWLGRDVKTFAYPYGGKLDYTCETARIVQEVGFRCACSNYHAHIYPWTDRYQLPRFLVRDWSGEEFEKRVSKYFV